MDKNLQTEKPALRPLHKPDPRQTELDARYQESVAWRNTVRTEDVESRKATRREDVAARESARKEDKEWREVMRMEDVKWRAEVRSEDHQHRLRTERLTKRCHALVAAAETSKAGSSLEEILGLAQQLESWLNREDK